jgi:hypothetical protein
VQTERSRREVEEKSKRSRREVEEKSREVEEVSVCVSCCPFTFLKVPLYLLGW